MSDRPQTPCRWAAVALAGAAIAAPAVCGQEPAAVPGGDEATAAAREPAADGTTSVVVPAPESRPEPPPSDASAPLGPGGQVAPPASGGITAPQDAVPAPPPATAPPSVLAPSGRPAASGAAVGPPEADATELLAAALEPLADPPRGASGQFYARPLTLLEALERAADPSRRLWVTQAYWKVSMAFASVRAASDALDRLELVAPGGDPHDRAALDVATAGARADLADARAVLGVAQQDLVDLARLPLSEPPPWPVDRPLAGPYQTHFDAIFANRVATSRVRAIARTLPARHEAVAARAGAVRAAATAAAMAEADHAKGHRPIEAVLAAHAALVAQQREFLQATRAYNLDIAEYAMAVADFSVPDDRFVSMLIGTPIQVRPQPGMPVGLAAPVQVPAAGVAPAAGQPVPLEAVPQPPPGPPGG
jgi:hypothetical protein